MTSHVDFDSTLEDNEILKGIKYKVRYVQVLMLFMNMVSSGVIRWLMSVAVLAMTEKSNNTDVTTYDWDKKIQGFILSSFFWGEMLMQFSAGILTYKYGAKRYMSTSCIVSGVLVMLLPLFATYGGWIGVCVSRVLQGIFQCFINPCVHSLLGKWAPLHERTRLGTFIFTGVFIGTIYSMPIASYLINSSYGWPWTLYIFGFQSIFFGFVWQIFGAESPSEHSSITMEEKRLIESSLNTKSDEKKIIPWKAILTSMPVIALVLTNIGCDWGFTVIRVEMPTYFRKVLKIDMKYIGYFTSLADLLAIFITLSSSVIADKLLSKNKSLTFIRKLFNSIAAGGAAISLTILALCFNGYYTSSIILIVFSVGFDSTVNSGFGFNNIDLSPNFAGVLYAISSNFTRLITMFGPTVTGLIVKDTSNTFQWSIVFLISALMYFMGNLVFLIFGSGKKQPWDSHGIVKDTELDNEDNLLEMQNI